MHVPFCCGAVFQFGATNDMQVKLKLVKGDDSKHCGRAFRPFHLTKSEPAHKATEIVKIKI